MSAWHDVTMHAVTVNPPEVEPLLQEILDPQWLPIL